MDLSWITFDKVMTGLGILVVCVILNGIFSGFAKIVDSVSDISKNLESIKNFYYPYLSGNSLKITDIHNSLDNLRDINNKLDNLNKIENYLAKLIELKQKELRSTFTNYSVEDEYSRILEYSHDSLQDPKFKELSWRLKNIENLLHRLPPESDDIR